MKTLYLVIILVVVAGSVILFVFQQNMYLSTNTFPNTSKFYTVIDTSGLNDTYQAGQEIHFWVNIHGYGRHPCADPDVSIYNEKNKLNLVFHDAVGVFSCPLNDEPENYTFDYPSKINPYITSINQTGNYVLNVSYGNTSIQKHFSVFLLNKDNMNNNLTQNYFSDNVTRFAIMNVNKIQNDTENRLSANMLMQLDVIGKTDAIHIYPIIVPWGNYTDNTVTLEDENHAPIVTKSGCNYDCGTFQTVLVIPSCVTEQGENMGPIKIADGPILSTSDHAYDRIFVKYSLPDILPENGVYHIKFVSPYYVKINLPVGSIVLSNHTSTCEVTLDPNKRSEFATDIAFETQ